MAIVQTAAEFLTISGQLLTRFSRLVQAFDAHDIDAVAGFLDDNVILNILTPPDMIIGKPEVLEYLGKKLRDEPAIYFKPLSTNVVAPTATVSGEALWIDDDTGPGGEDIHYSFTFALHADGNWYVINLWGTSP